MTGISEREFDAWREGNDAKLDIILEHIKEQRAFNLAIVAQVTEVRTEQRSSSAKASRWAAGISAVITAIITGIFALLSGGKP